MSFNIKNLCSWSPKLGSRVRRGSNVFGDLIS